MVLQAILNGLVDASVIVLGAVGLSLLYGVKKFANFAHGDMMTAGAYFAIFVMGATGSGIVGGLLGAMTFMALFGILVEFLIFAPLEGRGPIAPLIASLGLAIVLQNAIRLLFGTGQILTGLRVPDNWFFGIRDPLTGFRLSLNPLQGVVPLVMALVLVLAVTVLLQYTKLGKAMRATADNPDLARVSGISIRLVRFATWALASALAAAAGIILAIRLNNLVPLLGFNVLLLVFAAVILGGIGSPYGAMLGALVMSVAHNLYFPIALRVGLPEEFSLIVPFGIMLVVLFVRPQGIAGRPVGFDLPPLRLQLKGFFRRLLATGR